MILECCVSEWLEQTDENVPKFEYQANLILELRNICISLPCLHRTAQDFLRLGMLNVQAYGVSARTVTILTATGVDYPVCLTEQVGAYVRQLRFLTPAV